MLNFFKVISCVVVDEEKNFHIFFDDRNDCTTVPWQYCVERFRSFGKEDMKNIADDIEFI